jgi:poly(A) polymerase/tRNA nucleotidyltransferase (CCA-adding enzyme)
MSMTRAGAVFDYFGGVADLRAGRVRFVGDAAGRIAEDYLRVLRFFRFHARYGSGEADPAALAAIAAALPGLARLSAERVWAELKRILATPDPVAAVWLMQRLGVLQAVLPEGAAPERLARLVAAGAPADPLLRLAALLTGEAAALAERLKLSTAERERLTGLLAAPVPPTGADDATLRRLLADWPKDLLRGRLWLAGGDAATDARLAAMALPRFALRGRDLRAAGVPAGKLLGETLRSLRQWWLDGGCVADAAALQAELARRLAG